MRHSERVPLIHIKNAGCHCKLVVYFMSGVMALLAEALHTRSERASCSSLQ
jgi:hypothetical protein